ncbi:MAG TPA: TRIC cation channel family protein [Thermomicrobiales bacterium]|nr:TRIC cation channel family protein [Thermomicrobiales bacterium]
MGWHERIALLAGGVDRVCAGGGVRRDLLARDVPLILRSDVYPLAALAGALTFIVADSTVAGPVAAALGVGATFALWQLAIYFGRHAHRPRRTT